MHVLQITDCHLVAPGETLLGVDTQASLEAVLAQALGEHVPDAIIASGDLAHDPQPAIYRRFLQTVRAASAAPLMCLPGNHDVLAAMRAADLPMAPLRVGDWSLQWLDSHQDERPVAQVDADDRAALARALEAQPAPHVLLATHHPFVAVNAAWLDKDRIQNPAEVLQWCAGQCAAVGAELRAAIFGHAHQLVAGECAGLPVYGTPSTCFQFLPESETFTVDTQAPGYRWLQLGDAGAVETVVGRVTGFELKVELPERKKGA